MYTDSTKKENLFYFDDDEQESQSTNSKPVSNPPVQNDYYNTTKNRFRKLQGNDIGKMMSNPFTHGSEDYEYANMPVINASAKNGDSNKPQSAEFDVQKQGYVPGKRNLKNIPSLKKHSPGSAKEMQQKKEDIFLLEYENRPPVPVKEQPAYKYQPRAIPLNNRPEDIEHDHLQQIDYFGKDSDEQAKAKKKQSPKNQKQQSESQSKSPSSMEEIRQDNTARRKRPSGRKEKPEFDILQPSESHDHHQIQNNPADDEDPDVQVRQSNSSIQPPASRQNIPKVLRSEDITNKVHFLLNPVPKGYVMQATIKRDKSGFNMFYPRYDLYLSDGYKYLMSGKRRSGNVTSNYLISADKNDLEPKGPNYLGKVRSNVVGTEFHVFDDGCNPDKVEPGKQVRKNLSTVYYESNFFGTKGPRKLEVYIPNGESSHLQEGVDPRESAASNDVIKLVNKEPKWNQQLKAFVLNFNGRVDKPSVKNFILIQPGIDDNNVLLFGRTGEDVFTLDVQYPMSPIQAFGITLSSFDYKLACQ